MSVHLILGLAKKISITERPNVLAQTKLEKTENLKPKQISKSCHKHLDIMKAVKVSEEVKSPAFMRWQGRTKQNLSLAGAKPTLP